MSMTINVSETVFCRLCAEPKNISDVENLFTNIELRNEVIKKLRIFAENIVDFTIRNLPENVCTLCVNSLRNSSVFLAKIKRSQVVLQNLKFEKKDNENLIYEWDISNVIVKNEVPTAFNSDSDGSSSCKSLRYVNTKVVLNETPLKKELHDKISEKQSTVVNKSSNKDLGVRKTSAKKKINLKKKTFVPKTYSCAICDNTFKSFEELKCHRLTADHKEAVQKHKDATIGDLTCKVCFKTFSIPSKLKYHYVKHTVRRAEFTCDQCGKTFLTKSGAMAHQSVHNPDPQECRICKKTFHNLIRLKQHIKTHNESKPFKCNECPRSFRSKAQISSHMLVHLDLYKYSCEHCGKRFRFISTFKSHANVHTGAKPFACTECGRDFGNWANCNKHMMRIHGVTLAKTTITPIGRMPVNQKMGKANSKSVKEEIHKWKEQINKLARENIKDHN